MSTGYTFLNGFTVAAGFILALIALMLIITGGSGDLLLIIGLLIILLGLQGWQYIQTIVRLDDMAKEIALIRNNQENI